MSGGRGACHRCGGSGVIELPGRGKKQMNVGGLWEITCPVCKGGRQKMEEGSRRGAEAQRGRGCRL